MKIKFGLAASIVGTDANFASSTLGPNEGPDRCIAEFSNARAALAALDEPEGYLVAARCSSSSESA